MKEPLRYGFILGLICAVSAGLLALAQSVTGPKILQAAQAEIQSALKEVMPQGEKFEPVEKDNEVFYYRALDSRGKLAGYVFKAQAKGYSSIVETAAGMFCDGKICAIKVISLNETPGLGMRVAEKDFTSRFAGKNTAQLEEVAAITGATISSRAVIDSVKKKAQEIIKAANGG